MNIFEKFRKRLVVVIEILQQEGQLIDISAAHNVTVEPPRESSHGDLSTNAAMVLAKANHMKPHDLAKIIIGLIQDFEEIESLEIAGPGFINMRLKNEVWQNIVLEILSYGIGYGNSNLGQGLGYNIEYVSANPTGPMHIGHARGAVYGDALALLLVKAGYNVTKEYYINDAGGQIDTLAKSAFMRYREALGEAIEIAEGLYPGEYLKIVGESLAEQYGRDLLAKKEREWIPLVRSFAVDAMLLLIKKDLADLGIYHDVFTSEKNLKDNGKIEDALEIMQKKGLLYKGVLEAPKGKTPEDWEPREQTLFKATDFGDDVDRALKKSDGSYTYFAADMAYHLDKIERGANKMAIVLGADHGGYVKRLQAAVNALSDGKATIDVKISQLVNFMEDGQPMKMSKRAGTFTTVRDVINEVGKDVIRFIMLTRKNDMVLDFDLKLAKEQSKDNPVFYVQYAHARAQSVIRNAKTDAPEAYALYKGLLFQESKPGNTELRAGGNMANKNPAPFSQQQAPLRLITSEEELHLIKLMASWPRVIEASAIACEPHRIVFYLQELASCFHSLWNKGKDNATMRFIIKDQPELTAARLATLDAMAKVIASGLFIFNVEPLMEMR
jgi:arginyl-tRNA synthetase